MDDLGGKPPIFGNINFFPKKMMPFLWDLWWLIEEFFQEFWWSCSLDRPEIPSLGSEKIFDWEMPRKKRKEQHLLVLVKVSKYLEQQFLCVCVWIWNMFFQGHPGLLSHLAHHSTSNNRIPHLPYHTFHSSPDPLLSNLRDTPTSRGIWAMPQWGFNRDAQRLRVWCFGRIFFGHKTLLVKLREHPRIFNFVFEPDPKLGYWWHARKITT